MERGSLLCSVAALPRPKVADLSEAVHLNTHRNLLTVNDHLKAIVQLWFAVTRFAQWLIVYMICLMRKLPSKTSF